jgi:beta-glucosidase
MIEVTNERAIFEEHGLPFVQPGDMDAMAVPLDFLGLNYYTSIEVHAGDEDGISAVLAPGPKQPDGYTEMGWEITPGALTEYLIKLHNEYGPKTIVITENGASYSDSPDEDGLIHDVRRIEYLDSHIGATAGAIEAGVPVGGYFVWSLLDNLEWVAGYSQRFGIVWVDYATGQRTPKDSYYWYRQLIARSP